MYTAYRSTQPRTELGTGTGMCGPAPPQSQADPALRNMLECDNVSREHKGWIFFFFKYLYHCPMPVSGFAFCAQIKY